MMMSEDYLDEYQTRKAKLAALQTAGVIPYANGYEKTHSAAELTALGGHGELPAGETLMEQGAQNTYSTAGRMMMYRTHGKLSFATIRDHSGDIQLAWVKGLCKLHTGKELVEEIEIEGQTISAYKFVEKYLDVADFVGAKGELFVTKHGELTLFVNEFQLLSKALRPLGDKWHGIKDEEKLYRHRYLDMTMNEESYERFLLRSRFIKTLREFYWQEGFVEIETPILGNAASGAAAKPFVTHHHDYDTEVFLRIAPEIGLKKATVGRFEKVFEIGKQFRNEGSDPSHLQEFTSVEHYAAYRNYEDNMRFTEKMFAYLFAELDLPTTITIKDKEGLAREIDFSGPWEKIDYVAGLQEITGLDITTYQSGDEQKLLSDIKAAGHERVRMETMGVATLIDYLYKKVLRPTITGPAFVYNYPKTMQPLARQNDVNPTIVEQFQLVVNGREIIKAYSELADPQIQQENFDGQADALQKGDDEATSGDSSFILAMEHGMPPQSGRGMGIDRIVTLLTQQDNLRDSILFPLMKPLHTINNEQGMVNNGDTTRRDALHASPPSNDALTRSYTGLPTIDQAEALVDKYLTDTKRHCQQVGHVMRYFAQKLGEDEQLWYLAGLLHDLDRDHIAKDPDRHLKDDFERMMVEIDAPQALVDDIKSHGERLTGVPVDSTIRKYLASVDELSGFIYAYSLMRPTGYEGMKAKSITKKIKDKAFAAGVDREHLRHCEKYLDVPLAEFVPDVITALSSFEMHG